MNQLLNPFIQDYPESLDSSIPYPPSSAASSSSSIQDQDLGIPNRCRFNPLSPPPSSFPHTSRGSRHERKEKRAGLVEEAGPPVFAGSLLAVGTSVGIVDVLDVDTRRSIRRFGEGHVKGIEGISWSRNSRYLLSCSRDWSICIWDLYHSSCLMPSLLLPPSKPGEPSVPASKPTSPLRDRITLDAPVIDAQFHPLTSRIVLASLATQQVALILLHNSKRESSKSTSESAHEPEVIFLEDKDDSSAAGTPINGHEEKPEQAASSDDVKMEAPEGSDAKRKRTDGDEAGPEAGTEESTKGLTCAAFHPAGERIYVGTSKGMLLVFDLASRKVVSRTKISTTTLKQMVFDRLGRNLVVNSTDRAIRVLSIDDAAASVTPLHRFQDQISRTPWNAIGFSGDGEYVVGGAGTKESHLIYLWDRPSGALLKVLEGPKDSLFDCDWSAVKPLIASLTTAGSINFFQTLPTETWSAFAPGFEELDENREYEEKEAEFDIEDELETQRRQQAEEEQHIDVFTYPSSQASVYKRYITKGLQEETQTSDPTQQETLMNEEFVNPTVNGVQDSDVNAIALDEEPELIGEHTAVMKVSSEDKGRKIEIPADSVGVNSAQDVKMENLESQGLDDSNSISHRVGDGHRDAAMKTADEIRIWEELADEDIWPDYFPHVDLEEVDGGEHIDGQEDEDEDDMEV